MQTITEAFLCDIGGMSSALLVQIAFGMVGAI